MSETTRTITVEVEEEYGYRYWLWETGLSAEALLAFWREMETVPFFDPSVLPGRWTQVEGLPSVAVFEDTPEIEEIRAKLEKVERDTPEWSELGKRLGKALDRWAAQAQAEIARQKTEGTRPWTAHIHIEDDTYLADNFGRKYPFEEPKGG